MGHAVLRISAAASQLLCFSGSGAYLASAGNDKGKGSNNLHSDARTNGKFSYDDSLLGRCTQL